MTQDYIVTRIQEIDDHMVTLLREKLALEKHLKSNPATAVANTLAEMLPESKLLALKIMRRSFNLTLV